MWLYSINVYLKNIMELIQQPELKNKYDKCKYVVKLWEHNFKKKHGRPPSKLDIKEADKNVRNAYKTYFNLKSAALEESFNDVDGFNLDEDVLHTSDETNTFILNEDNSLISTDKDVENLECNTSIDNIECNTNTEKTWGKHLNNEKKVIKTKEKEHNTSVNLTITQKLFNRTKLSKRNPRKSLSFQHKKSETSQDSLRFLSQPSSSFTFSENDLKNDDSNFNKEIDNILKNDVKVSFCSEKIITQPTNLIQTILDNQNISLKTVDTGWLARVSSQNVGSAELDCNFNGGNNLFSQMLVQSVKLTDAPSEAQYNNESDDIIDSSDNEEVPCSILHVNKKRKIDSSNTDISHCSSNLSTSTEYKENSNVLDSSSIKSKKSALSKQTTNKNALHKKDFIDKNVKKEIKSSEKKNNKIFNKNLRQRKGNTNLKESSGEEEKDPFYSDGNSSDPDFNITDVNETVKDIDKHLEKKTITTKRQQKKVKKKLHSNDELKPENDKDIYELEYSVKPRVVSVPRVKNLKILLTKAQKNEVKSAVQCKEKQQQQKERLEKKIESGTLNDNFVRINLKKKIYARGKKTTNFSKYKKQQWKNKKKSLAGPDMDMGGCDGGILTCFNCGQAGHFARQCKAIKGDSLLPLETEEVCPYPTLEEASKLAGDSVLAIRKPNILSEKDKTDEIVEAQNENDIVEEKNTNDEANEVKNNENLFDSDDDADLLAEAIKVEENFAKLNMQQYLDTAKTVQAIYSKKEDGSLIDTPAEVFTALHKFGYSAFRPGQELAIMRILSGLSTLVTLSTGSGKSLCYQIPAYLYSQKQHCISLVISPLVSLMEDQVTGIPAFLKAACLHTNQTSVQRDKIMNAISSGNINVLLVSPEAVVAGEKSSGFGSLLRQLPPIAFACIDEVHCVSQWSHNFRPSYLMICHVLRDRLGVNTVLGLTATATKSTRDSIIKHLQIPDGDDGVISDIPLPDNLYLSVSRDVQRDLALVNLLLSERFNKCKSIIVYCTRREECERIASYLRTTLKSVESFKSDNKKRKRLNVQAEPYHAGLSASRRRTIQKSFMTGELRIVVATVAFGMGINKADIRAVIHYNMPKNFESYVQEIGRAGRDGLPAHCHLFLDSQRRDENELRRHIHANSVDRHVIRKLLQKIFLPCSCKSICPKHEVAFSIQETVLFLDISEEIISTLLCYLELHKNKYIEVLSPAYIKCKIISYAGGVHIRKAAKECPPLAMALALYQKENTKNDNVLEFPIVDVASAIGWDSGICKYKLKNLEWIIENNISKRSPLSIQFSNLGFRLLAPGNLIDSQLDEALDNLHNHVIEQERTSLLQLQAIHEALNSVASTTYKTCILENDLPQSDTLKTKIREYFNSPNPLENLPDITIKKINEEQIINDIRALVCMYKDNVFTGRAVARIFHGIQSPNYPAAIWGRCKFWRAHIASDFHNICEIATKELLRMRL